MADSKLRVTLCDECNCPAEMSENEYGEFICDDCEQNKAEAAWERHCEDFHDGGSTAPWPDRQRVLDEQARKLK